MKKVTIDGICKIDVYKNRNGDFSTVEINGVRLEQLLAKGLLKDSPVGEDIRKVGLCKATIMIESHTETLTINGVEMPLEL